MLHDAVGRVLGEGVDEETGAGRGKEGTWKAMGICVG